MTRARIEELGDIRKSLEGWPPPRQSRARIIRALQARDAVAARREIENDIDQALSYVAQLADDAGYIAPAAPKAVVGQRRGRRWCPRQFDYVQ